MDKCGSFEWIVEFDEIKPYLCLPGQDVSNLSVLVVGCGTSDVSYNLLSLGFKSVLSIDNDMGTLFILAFGFNILGCILCMKERYSHLSALEWYCCDVVTGEGFEQNPLLEQGNSFDLIVDKGTLDAVLVEGSCCSMLAHMNRLLKSGSRYVICSLSPADMMVPLLSIPSLCFEVDCAENCNSGEAPYALKNVAEHVIPKPDGSSVKGTVLTCIKRNKSPVNLMDVEEQEKDVLDTYFKEKNSLLTPEYCNRLLEAFANGPLCFQEAYRVMFGGYDNALDYSFELFSEDLSRIFAVGEGVHDRQALTEPHSFTYDEAIYFIQHVQ
jgi:hypothetical protein